MLEQEVPYILSISDKLEHFLSFTGLAILPVIARRSARRALPALILVFVLAVLLEEGQTFSPTRTVDPKDMAANSAGAMSGMLAGCFAQRAFRKSRSARSIVRLQSQY
jgi:VanZ family protein